VVRSRAAEVLGEQDSSEQTPVTPVVPAVDGLKLALDSKIEEFDHDRYKSWEIVELRLRNSGNADLNILSGFSEVSSICKDSKLKVYKLNDKKELYSGSASKFELEDYTLKAGHEAKLFFWFETPNRNSDVKCDLQLELVGRYAHEEVTSSEELDIRFPRSESNSDRDKDWDHKGDKRGRR
jgi:hypothetical protein